MSKWIWNGTTLANNPSKDSGWQPDGVMTEQHPIGNSSSVLQIGGVKSQKREVQGITFTSVEKNLIVNAAGSVISITDHHGLASSVYVESVKIEEMQDVKNLTLGTWSYQIKLIKR